MSDYVCLQQKSFVKGLSASADPFDIPRGATPRGSNLILSKRGALKACDGTQIVNAFTGIPVGGRGRIMSSVLFQPIGVSPYYLLLAKALDQHLGPPTRLAITDAGAGGTLAAGTYFYVVTAVDGAGGETTVSNEVSILLTANHKPSLTWNTVPNAAGYNVYRGTVAGAEGLITSSPLSANSLVDTGLAQTVFSFPITTATTARLADGTSIYTFTTSAPPFPAIVDSFTVTGSGLTIFDQTYTNIVSASANVLQAGLPIGAPGGFGLGGTLTIPTSPPTSDTTQQTALFQLPPGVTGRIAYDNSNIVALFPADLQIDGLPGGGTGGHGTTGSGSSGPAGSTASGGVAGNISNIPQMLQYTNRIAIALGNGFPPQLYSDDTGTSDSPAITVAITAISVDAFGVVTVTAAHGFSSQQVGANVLVQGVTNPLFNSVGPTLTIPDNGHVTMRNLAAIGQAPSAGGTLTFTTIPFYSTFTAGYPVWAAMLTTLVGDLIVPTAANGHYYKCIQAGITGSVQPTFPTGKGQTIAEGSGSLVVWQEAGQTNASAPAPPGAAHLAVFAGSLWAFNTSPTNTANGLDGPTCLRMCDSNNANSWNPINQAFLDKDDGTDGMGLASFTVTAQGIPPEGSLVACKDFATYQIIGVFGAQNFAIQRIKSDMGCIAPRTLTFIPGFGIGRYTHLGFAVFDSVEDKLISEDIRPYLFPSNDPSYTDITVVDANWVGVSWSAQTSNPPMFVAAMPIGMSGGALTRLFCYDLVLKAWTYPVDLPFPISNLYQARSEPSNPVTLMGSFSDGTFQRWQAGDLQWATSASGSLVPAPISGFARSPETYNGFPLGSQAGRLYIRKVMVRGNIVDPSATLQPFVNLQDEGPVAADYQQFSIGAGGGYELDVSVNETILNAHMDLYFTGAIELDSWGWFVKPLAADVPAVLT